MAIAAPTRNMKKDNQPHWSPPPFGWPSLLACHVSLFMRTFHRRLSVGSYALHSKITGPFAWLAVTPDPALLHLVAGLVTGVVSVTTSRLSLSRLRVHLREALLHTLLAHHRVDDRRIAPSRLES
jgi:hypothetical protein